MGALHLRTEAGAKGNHTTLGTVETLLASRVVCFLFFFNLEQMKMWQEKRSIKFFNYEHFHVCSDHEAISNTIENVFLWSVGTFSFLITHGHI